MAVLKWASTGLAGQCLHFECRGAPARVRVWRGEGRPPFCPTTLCVWRNLPYLTLQPPAHNPHSVDVYVFRNTKQRGEGEGAESPSDYSI